jgi:outer membrane immunogenic protein
MFPIYLTSQFVCPCKNGGGNLQVVRLGCPEVDVTRHALLVAAATALISAPALSADLRRPPPPAPVVAPAPLYNWSGFYIGLQGGFGSAELERTLGATGVTFTNELSGGLLGGTVGFNWQAGAWVFGFEADYAWANISRSVDNCFAIPLVTCSSGLDSFGTARLRVGGAWGPALIYATGGLAFGNHFVEVFDNFTGLGVERSEFAVGWTVGGGIEWGFAPGWSLKAEALFFDLDVDRFNTGLLGLPALVDIDHQLTGVVVRGGINYRFNWGGSPVIGSY